MLIIIKYLMEISCFLVSHVDYTDLYNTIELLRNNRNSTSDTQKYLNIYT